MKLRRFNDAGIAAFQELLDRLRVDSTVAPTMNLLTEERFTEPLDQPIVVELRSFTNRLDFAAWLQDAANASGSRVPQRDPGFWSWLALLLFDDVCPTQRGKRKVGADARYILNPDWKRRYRHLLATPFQIFYMHSDNPQRAAVVLSQPISVPGELTEQLASRQELVSCPGTMALATRLFVDETSGKPRVGASGRAANRLGKLLNQYTRTWDIAVMDVAQATSLLPDEFERFRT